MKGRSGTASKRGRQESEASEDNHGISALKGSDAHKTVSWPGKKRGGKVEGSEPKKRLDRKAYARGGAVKKGGKTTVNVIIAPQGGDKGAGQMPPPSGAPAAPAMPPPGPPVPPRPPMPMPGAPAPGMPMPPMGRKSGGRVTYPIKDGAGGGEGRKEKIKAYGAKAREGEKG